MICIRENADIYEITFPYDPLLISYIKNVPGKQWVPSAKMWTIPKDKLGFLLNELKGTQYESIINVQSTEHINENASLDVTTHIPNIDISGIPFYVKQGAQPYQHQLDFMKYAIDREQRGHRNGFLVCDEQGLGKTGESMNLAIYNHTRHQFKHCLVICCVNSSKYNWSKDISEHTRGAYTPYILGTRFRRDKISTRADTGAKEKLADLRTGHMYGDPSKPELPYFLIVNIEAFRAKEGKTYPFTDEILKYILSGKLQMIIIDEVHKNVSPQSAQGKQLLELKAAIGDRVQWIPMTGTPIVNKPVDLFLPLKLIDAHRFSSYYTWCKEFVIYGGYGHHEIMGYKNIPRLKAMLQHNMIRRLKQDVLDLPPKIYYTEYVENTAYQNKLYKQIVGELEENESEILQSLDPRAKLLRLRQVNGSPELIDSNIVIDDTYIKKNAKLQRVMEILDDAAERGEKTLIFSNWVEPLRTLYKFISKRYKTCCFTGTMSDTLREKHKRVFMTDPEYTVMIGTIGAMGTTHTLTAATNVIFYDEPWTPSDKAQAEDRAHRIGTISDAVNIFTILSKDTVDDKVHDILYTKDSIGKFIVDNELDLRNNPELFHFLLRDQKKFK